MQPSGTRNCWFMTLSMQPGMQPAPYINPRNIVLNPIVLVALMQFRSCTVFTRYRLVINLCCKITGKLSFL